MERWKGGWRGGGGDGRSWRDGKVGMRKVIRRVGEDGRMVERWRGSGGMETEQNMSPNLTSVQ